MKFGSRMTELAESYCETIFKMAKEEELYVAISWSSWAFAGFSRRSSVDFVLRGSCASFRAEIVGFCAIVILCSSMARL